jgi:rhodanese-related sulfurtransferase
VIAISLLRSQSITNVANLVGGLAAWTSAQQPTHA